MSLSLTSSLIRVPVSPVTPSVYSGVNVKCVHIQVRGKEGQKEQSQKTFSAVSRRALATQLAIASLAATTIILPEPAEARISNPEIKRKFFEKMKLLREKLGLSKRDTENEDKTSSPAAVEKEKPLEKTLAQLPLSPLPVQTAEASLP